MEQAFLSAAALRAEKTSKYVPDPTVEPPRMEAPAWDIAELALAEVALAPPTEEPQAVPTEPDHGQIVPPAHEVVIVDDDITISAAEMLVPPPAIHIVQRRPKPPPSLVTHWEASFSQPILDVPRKFTSLAHVMGPRGN